jgi:hypothetical protein
MDTREEIPVAQRECREVVLDRVDPDQMDLFGDMP